MSHMPELRPRPLGFGKPILRGVSHAIAAFVSLGGGIVLWQQSNTRRGQWASLVFTFSLVFLFSVSGMYHVINWRPSTRKWWRRLDHAAIFLQIAGTYTPICLLVLEGDSRLLSTIWIGAGIGILQSIFWVTIPKSVTALVYVALGWIGFHFRQEIFEKTGPEWCALILVGGGLYTIGAMIYALKRPNPYPKAFGYHACHFQAVRQLVQRPKS